MCRAETAAAVRRSRPLLLSWPRMAVRERRNSPFSSMKWLLHLKVAQQPAAQSSDRPVFREPCPHCSWLARALYAAFFTRISTRRPATISMLTSASRLNLPIFPRSRSLIRGCVTPKSFAARACVISRASARILDMSCARSRRFSASRAENPTSSKTWRASARDFHSAAFHGFLRCHRSVRYRLLAFSYRLQ